MYDEIIEIAENKAYIDALRGAESSGPNLDLLKKFRPYSELKSFEQNMRNSKDITFTKVFHEPLGYYHLRCFLVADYSVDKAVFVSDVELYRTVRDPSARKKVAQLLYDRFVADEKEGHVKGKSVFVRRRAPYASAPPDRSKLKVIKSTDINGSPSRPTSTHSLSNPSSSQLANFRTDRGGRPSISSLSVAEAEELYLRSMSLNMQGNTLGVYGRSVREVKDQLSRGVAGKGLFDAVAQDVLDDLRMDVFPRFEQSWLYKRYIQCKHLENRRFSVKDFDTLRILGRGAFGAVNACLKRDTGKLYAMKCLNKRRVLATDSVDTVMHERNFLSMMKSDFVVWLKYAVMDRENLYLILDLMTGGDLKYHLNKDTIFSEDRSRFYAAEILLGLEHIHSHNIIYRDVKLENMLLDEKGHVKISDLGLAIRTTKSVRGYAGTPGYTAPEVILNQYYDRSADFFSFGVMIYRFLCGKKPFARGSSDIDKNVVEIEPEYPEEYFSPVAVSLLKALMQKDPRKRLGTRGIDEIKSHPWFHSIDFGLLDAGYLKPPFVPDMNQVNADSMRHMTRPPNDDKYKKVRLTDEFERQLDGFPYTSYYAYQQEIVEVLQKKDINVVWEKFHNTPLEDVEEQPQRRNTQNATSSVASENMGHKNQHCCVCQ